MTLRMMTVGTIVVLYAPTRSKHFKRSSFQLWDELLLLKEAGRVGVTSLQNSIWSMCMKRIVLINKVYAKVW